MREHRVVGPPGTGKTTYLQRQFEAAIRSGRYGPADLFACSLTRAAATELASRVSGVPERNVGTLHSHAYRGLQYPKIVETTSGLKDWNEYCGSNRYRIGTQHAANPENAPAEPLSADSDGIKLLQQADVLRHQLRPRELWPVGVQAFIKRWEEFKTETGRVDFTDLIEAALASEGQLEGCRVLFVDEAQDMSKLEFALVRMWGGKCDEFIVVGDPDQNLYEWRGADPDAFYSAKAETERVLEHSYRVPQEVHRTAVDWIKQISGRKDAAYFPTSEHGRIEKNNATFKDCDALIESILARLDAPRAKADGETAMVLVSCGYMLHSITARLRELGVPFHNPYRRGFHAWNPLNNSYRLLSFLQPDRQVWGDEARMWTWGDLDKWGTPLQSRPVFSRGFKSIIENRNSEDRFRDSQRDELVPLPYLFENLVSDDVRSKVVDMDVEWWYDNLLHDHRKRMQFSITVARRYGADRLREQPRIIVGTIHSVKGGEADHVYLFPDLSSAGYYGAWRTSTKAKWSVVRQFYVGMTRARQSLTLCEAQSDLAVEWL